MMLLDWSFVLVLFGLAGASGFFWARKDRHLSKRLLVAFGVLLFAALLILRSDLSMQKLVSNLVMPTGLFWLGLGGLTIHLAALRMKGAAIFSGVLFAFYTLFTNGWIASSLLAYLEDQYPEYSLADGATFDAVFVLGGGALERPKRNPELSEVGDRVLLAARMYHRHKTPLLVSSGSTIPGLSEPQDLARAAAIIWEDLAIPESAIVRLPDPKNTSGEIAAYKRLIEERHFEHVGVISSASHLPRVMRLARAAGLEMTPLPADHRGGTGPFHPILLIPQVGAFKRTQAACWEILGMIMGR